MTKAFRHTSHLTRLVSRHAAARKACGFRKRSSSLRASGRIIAPRTITLPAVPTELRARGYDPELLYVECARCGAPVLWEKGKTTILLEHAAIDPLELDASCILVTDGCPACGSKREYSVQIFRISASDEQQRPLLYGNS